MLQLYGGADLPRNCLVELQLDMDSYVIIETYMRAQMKNTSSSSSGFFLPRGIDWASRVQARGHGCGGACERGRPGRRAGARAVAEQGKLRHGQRARGVRVAQGVVGQHDGGTTEDSDEKQSMSGKKNQIEWYLCVLSGSGG